MGKLQLFLRRFKRRFLGAHYCTIESVNTHSFRPGAHVAGVGRIYRCAKCGIYAVYCPYLGGFHL